MYNMQNILHMQNMLNILKLQNMPNMQNMYSLHIQGQMSENSTNVDTWVDNLTLLPVLSMS
jgi:hypothetical protein